MAGRSRLQVQRGDIQQGAVRADRQIALGPLLADQGQAGAIDIEQREAHADPQAFGQLGGACDAGVSSLVVRLDGHRTAGDLHAAGQLGNRVADLVHPHDAAADPDTAGIAARLGELQRVDILARRDLQTAIFPAVHGRAGLDQGGGGVVQRLDHRRAAHAERRRLVAEKREEIARPGKARRRIPVRKSIPQSALVQVQVHDPGDADQFHVRRGRDVHLLVVVLHGLIQPGPASDDRLRGVVVLGVAHRAGDRDRGQVVRLGGVRGTGRPDVHDPGQAQGPVQERRQIPDEVVFVRAVEEAGERQQFQRFDQQRVRHLGRDVDRTRRVDHRPLGSVAVDDRLDVIGVEAQRHGHAGSEFLGAAQVDIALRRHLGRLRHGAALDEIQARDDFRRRAQVGPHGVLEQVQADPGGAAEQAVGRRAAAVNGRVVKAVNEVRLQDALDALQRRLQLGLGQQVGQRRLAADAGARIGAVVRGQVGGDQDSGRLGDRLQFVHRARRLAGIQRQRGRGQRILLRGGQLKPIGIEHDGEIDSGIRQTAERRIALGDGRTALQSVPRARGAGGQGDRRAGVGRQLQRVVIHHNHEVLRAVGQTADRGAAAGQVGHRFRRGQAMIRQPDRAGRRIEGRDQGGIEVDLPVGELGDLHLGNDAERVQSRAQRGAGRQRNFRAIRRRRRIHRQLNVIGIDADDEVVRVVGQAADRVAAAGLIADFVAGTQSVPGQLDGVQRRVHHRRCPGRIERRDDRVALEALHRAAAGREQVDGHADRGILQRVGQADRIGVQTDRVVIRSVRERGDGGSRTLPVRDSLAGLDLVSRRENQVADRVDFVRGEPMAAAGGPCGQVEGDAGQGVVARSGQLKGGFGHGDGEVVVVVAQAADRRSAPRLISHPLAGDVVVEGSDQHRVTDRVDHRLRHGARRIEGDRPRRHDGCQGMRAVDDGRAGLQVDRHRMAGIAGRRRQLNVPLVDLDHEVLDAIRQAADHFAVMTLVRHLVARRQAVIHQRERVGRNIEDQFLQIRGPRRVDRAGLVRRVEDGRAAEHGLLGQARIGGIDQGVAGGKAVAGHGEDIGRTVEIGARRKRRGRFVEGKDVSRAAAATRQVDRTGGQRVLPGRRHAERVGARRNGKIGRLIHNSANGLTDDLLVADLVDPDAVVQLLADREPVSGQGDLVVRRIHGSLRVEHDGVAPRERLRRGGIGPGVVQVQAGGAGQLDGVLVHDDHPQLLAAEQAADGILGLVRIGRVAGQIADDVAVLETMQGNRHPAAADVRQDHVARNVAAARLNSAVDRRLDVTVVERQRDTQAARPVDVRRSVGGGVVGDRALRLDGDVADGHDRRVLADGYLGC